MFFKPQYLFVFNAHNRRATLHKKGLTDHIFLFSPPTRTHFGSIRGNSGISLLENRRDRAEDRKKSRNLFSSPSSQRHAPALENYTNGIGNVWETFGKHLGNNKPPLKIQDDFRKAVCARFRWK